MDLAGEPYSGRHKGGTEAFFGGCFRSTLCQNSPQDRRHLTSKVTTKGGRTSSSGVESLFCVEPKIHRFVALVEPGKRQKEGQITRGVTRYLGPPPLP